MPPVRSWPPGGLRRLLERGAVYPDCRHLASTFTSTTISTLATGAWPAQHGIVADFWYDRAAGRAVKASEEALAATTLLEQIEAEPRMRSWVIGMEESDAALFAGAGGSRLYWMNEEGLFATRGDAPDWLDPYNQQKNPEAARNAHWVAMGAKPDAPPLRTLDYSPEHARDFLNLYKASPWGQGAQFDFLAELMTRERMGQNSTTDVVCLLLGSMERLGHETGGRSPLMQQMVLQLDRRLEALLAQLGKTLGENAFNLAMVGAHGAPPEPAEDSRARMAVNGENVAQAVTSAGWPPPTAAAWRNIFTRSCTWIPAAYRDPEPIRLQARARRSGVPRGGGIFHRGRRRIRPSTGGSAGSATASTRCARAT